MSKKRSNRSSPQAGFSLVEVALALAVMGIVMGLALTPLLSLLHLGKNKTTELHQEAVLQALAAYALRHGVLPCPAKPFDQGSSPESCSSINELIGGVPYITLGLPEKYAYDGYNQPLIYAIPSLRSAPDTASYDSFLSSSLQAKEAALSFCGMLNESSNKLYIKNQHDKLIVDGDQDDFVAVVILSLGEDRSAEGEGPEERLNRALGLEFIDRPYSSNPGHPYRHVLKWATRDFLAHHYGQLSCPALRANDQFRANESFHQ